MRKLGMAQKIAEHTDLQTEPMPGECVVEIFGSSRVLVENHRGVLECTREKISLCCRGGTLWVGGKRLTIALMNRHRLVICGDIESVTISKGDK